MSCWPLFSLACQAWSFWGAAHGMNTAFQTGTWWKMSYYFCLFVFPLRSSSFAPTTIQSHCKQSQLTWLHFWGKRPCCGNLFGDYSANRGDLYCSSVHLLCIVFPSWRSWCALLFAENLETSGTELSGLVSSVDTKMCPQTLMWLHTQWVQWIFTHILSLSLCFV